MPTLAIRPLASLSSRSSIVVISGCWRRNSCNAKGSLPEDETPPSDILTIEDPIEYVYKSKKALIHQREVGSDVTGFAAALRSALREDPDVILVGEMRDYETISAAVTAAETPTTRPPLS